MFPSSSSSNGARRPTPTYGIRRVCQAWGVPRSSFYAAQAPAPESAVTAAPPARHGPKPAITDEGLLAAIKRDLTGSPWNGEGHRKVWARLRVRGAIRVSRKRLLRLMREHALLSPHRARRRNEDSHERQIITTAPNVMQAIDATQVTIRLPGKEHRTPRAVVVAVRDGLALAVTVRRLKKGGGTPGVTKPVAADGTPGVTLPPDDLAALADAAGAAVRAHPEAWGFPGKWPRW